MTDIGFMKQLKGTDCAFYSHNLLFFIINNYKLSKVIFTLSTKK